MKVSNYEEQDRKFQLIGIVRIRWGNCSQSFYSTEAGGRASSRTCRKNGKHDDTKHLVKMNDL